MDRGAELTTLIAGVLARVDCRGSVCAAAVLGGPTVGSEPDAPVTPASVMKIQVALTALTAMERGDLEGTSRVLLRAQARTPGPVGVSLLQDDVEVSVRDLVPMMLSISDNVATDALLGLVGVDEVNAVTQSLGLTQTRVAADLMTMLDEMAVEAGFANYAALQSFTSSPDGGMSSEALRGRLAATAALDPRRGSSTTARDTVRLLQLVWTDAAGPATVCAALRLRMGEQLTQHRIASGFGSDVSVAAKSGGLMGVVRNEAGVVTLPDGSAYAVAVFTRSRAGVIVDGRGVDAAIGEVARAAVDALV